MGTSWKVEAYFTEELEREQYVKLSQDLSQIVFGHEMILSDWIEESELRLAEKRGMTRWQKASPTFASMLHLSDIAHRLSDGAFDPTIGAVLWKKTPSAVGWELELNDKMQRFRFKKDPLRLTFGGIAKGFSVGVLARSLIEKGAEAFVINAGGGNYAFWGSGSPNSCAKNMLCFLSHSRRKRPDNKGDHIISSKKKDESRPDHLRLQCQNNPSDDLPKAGALNDAFSTALILNDFRLPSNCRVLR